MKQIVHDLVKKIRDKENVLGHEEEKDAEVKTLWKD